MFGKVKIQNFNLWKSENSKFQYYCKSQNSKLQCFEKAKSILP